MSQISPETLGRALAEAIRSTAVYAEQAKRHIQTAAYFRRLVEMNIDRWPFEYAAWASQVTRPA